MYVLANLAMQHKSGMSMDPHKMLIDYIRVYSNDPNAKAVALDRVSSPDGADTDGLYGATATGGSVSPPPTTPTVPKPTEPTPTTPKPPVPTTPAKPSPSTGTAEISLKVSGDHFKGDPQFKVWVDGVQAGGAYTVEAVHAKKAWETIKLPGGYDPAKSHTIRVEFINDGWDGKQGEGHDRNIFIDAAKIGSFVVDLPKALISNSAEAGQGFVSPNAAVMMSNGSMSFKTPPVGTTAPTTSTGTEDLVLKVSGDRLNGNPQFKVFVDGKQAGGIFEAKAVHAKNAWEEIKIGSFAKGNHKVEVKFINDRWDGRSGDGHDRNLFIDEVRASSHVVDGAKFTSNTAGTGYGHLDKGAAVMVWNGSAVFDIFV
jgi:hypothetical protein